MTTTNSLHRQHPHHWHIPLLITISAVTLLFGLWLPVITLHELVFWKHTFSVLSGILSLIVEKHYVLGFIILFFSVIFPFFKLMILLVVWCCELSLAHQKKLVELVSGLGKWSMLDVFVVAITIVVAKISKFASAEPQIGIYFFGFSIVMAIIATMRIEKLLKKT